ncbi:MAG TPA: hypothetical protein VGE51_10110 [Fontimonas sp.]
MIVRNSGRLPGLLVSAFVLAATTANAQEPESDPAPDALFESSEPAEPGTASDISVIEVAPLRDEPEAPGPSEPQTAQLDTIEVTGSRIRRSDFETAQPVTVVTREDIARTGLSNVGDLLQELPSAGSALSRSLSTPALSEDEAASLLLKAWHGRSGAMAPAVPPALLTEALLPYMVRSGVCSGGVLEAGGLVCHIGNPVAPQRLAGVAVANALQTTTPRLPDPASPLTRIYLRALSRQASHAAPTLLPASLSEADDHHGMLVVVRYAIKTATLSVAQLDIAAAHRQPVWR